MELRQLRCFFEAARFENMTRASEILNISQPALSISIKKLEDEINTKLFIRKGHSIKLSESGKAILPIVERMLSYETEIVNTCKDFEAGKSELRIKMCAAQPFVMDVVSSFHQEFPNIQIRMIQDEKLEGEPDVIIDASLEKPFKKQGAIVYKEEIVVAVPRIINPVNESYITIEYLSENELIGLSKKYPLGEIEEYYCSHYALNLKHPIICDNPSVLRNLLINGMGIAFVPSKTWILQNNPSLSLVPFEIPDWIRYITAETTGYRNNSTVPEQFLQYLGDRFSRL